MADPASILGIVSAAGTIAAAITRTVHSLSQLRDKYHNADLTIRLLIGELTTIKAALIQIEDWAKYNSRGSVIQRDLADAFEVSLDGCKLALDALAEEVAELVEELPESAFMFRTRYIWNEANMQDHKQRLQGQISALQLLLQAVQIRTLPGQAALLREPRNRQLIQKVRDDSSSLRNIARSSRAGTDISGSVRSTPSTIASARLGGLDYEILNSAVYRRNGAHAIARHAHPDAQGGNNSPMVRTNGPVQTDRTPDTSIRAQSLIPSAARNPIPQIVQPSEYQQREPYERSVASAPLPQGPFDDHASLHTIAASDSALYRGLIFPFRTKSASENSKPGFLQTLRGHKSRLSLNGVGKNKLSPIPSQLSLGPGARRGRRRSETNLHESINLNSPDGQNVPQLVKAAQFGSNKDIEELLDENFDIEETHAPTGRTALAVAAHCGNDDVTALLLQRGAKVNVVDKDKMTPLHLAASRGHYSVVQRLLQEDAEIDASGPEGKTPLRLASENRYPEVAELLLRNRSKVNTRCRHQLTSLHAAAKLGDHEMVNVLMQNGASVEAKDSHMMEALHYAAQGGHESIVEALLTKTKNVDSTGKENMTALSCACAAGHLGVVKSLLRRKASIKHQGAGHMTPLHWACFNGHTEVVEFLIQKKAAVDARTTDGRTPLHLAIRAKNFPTAELLIRNRAMVEAQCVRRMRPIHYACETGDEDLVRLLIGYKADIEAESDFGRRPLHLATLAGHKSIIDLLLDNGANIEAREATGERALCLACVNGQVEVVQQLLDRGAAMRLRFASGPSHEDSPLCLAAKYGHLSVVLELISRGASVRQKDEQEWQPLRYAAYFGHPEIVQILLESGASIIGLSQGQWGFNMTATRIGFAPGMGIDDERKSHVLALLQDAEAREEETAEAALAKATAPALPVHQDGPAEIDTPLPPTRAPPPRPSNTVASIAALASAMNSQTPPSGLYSLAAPGDQPYVPLPPTSQRSAPIFEPYEYYAPPRSNTFDSLDFATPPAPTTYNPPPYVPDSSSRGVSLVSPPQSTASIPPYRPPRPPAPLSLPSTEELEQVSQLTCDNCKAAGEEYPRMTCEACRLATFRFAYANQPPNTQDGNLEDRRFSFQEEVFEMAAR